MPKATIDKHELTRRERMTIEQGRGIFPQHEVFYIQSIMYAATASFEAFERFSRSVSSADDASTTVLHVQEALTHAAALSRFFWPARDKGVAVARATKLRSGFAMDGSSLQDRELRNALEHFDERLDHFLLTDPIGFFFPGAIVDSHAIADEALGQVFRLVDPHEFVFVILGTKHDFLSIRDEVVRILALARQFDKNGGRLPR